MDIFCPPTCAPTHRVTHRGPDSLRFEVHPPRCLNAYMCAITACIPAPCYIACSSIDYYELMPNGELRYYKKYAFQEKRGMIEGVTGAKVQSYYSGKNGATFRVIIYHSGGIYSLTTASGGGGAFVQAKKEVVEAINAFVAATRPEAFMVPMEIPLAMMGMIMGAGGRMPYGGQGMMMPVMGGGGGGGFMPGVPMQQQFPQQHPMMPQGGFPMQPSQQHSHPHPRQVTPMNHNDDTTTTTTTAPVATSWFTTALNGLLSTIRDAPDEKALSAAMDGLKGLLAGVPPEDATVATRDHIIHVCFEKRTQIGDHLWNHGGINVKYDEALRSLTEKIMKTDVTQAGGHPAAVQG